MTGTEDPSTSAIISRMLVARPPGVFRRRITTSTRRSPAVVSASFTCLEVAGPIAPSISIISAGLPISCAGRSVGEANWTAAAIAATRVACTILTARHPNKTVYGVVLPHLNRIDARSVGCFDPNRSRAPTAIASRHQSAARRRTRSAPKRGASCRTTTTRLRRGRPSEYAVNLGGHDEVVLMQSLDLLGLQRDRRIAPTEADIRMIQPHHQFRGSANMERDQQRFFVRNQFFEPQRSRLSWTSRLRGILASDLSKPECHKGRRLSFQDARRG